MAWGEKRAKGEYPWTAVYRIGTKPNGKPLYKKDPGFRTEKDAEDHGRLQEAAVRAGRWHDPRRGEITLDDYWAKWLVGYDTSARNLLVRQTHYRTHLKPRWGHVALKDIDALDVAAFEKELRGKVSRKYASSIMELLRMLMEDAQFARLIEFTPVRAQSRRGQREPSQARVGRVTDIPTVMAVCHRLPAPEALMTLTALFTGMRWGEVVGVRRSFLDLHPARGGKPARGTYTIDPAVGAVHEINGRRFYAWPKGRKGRVIELPEFLVVRLLAHLETFPKERDLLWCTSTGLPFDRGNYNNRRWRPACDGWDGRDAVKGRSALLPAPAVAEDLHMHDLRHTHKTWLAEDGIEAVARDERLGHVTPGMDGVYIHPTAAMRARVLASLQARWETYAASMS